MDSEQKDHKKEEPNILDVYQEIIECQAKEANEFLNNKYAPRRHNTNNIFPDNSAFLTFAFINNEIALDQYIKDQRKRQKNIKSGKLRVNHNKEFSKRYIPGKRSTNFPTTSFLTRNQMTAAYHHFMNHKTHKEVFASQILEEIEEFQAYAQQMWRKVNYQRALQLDPNVKSIIDSYWETKICAAKLVHPSVYSLVSTVPLTLSEEDSKQIHLTHESDLLTEGTYHEINEITTLKQEHYLSTCSKDMTAWLQFKQKCADSPELMNRLDEDKAAESLAVMRNAQVVMTTSSVKTLLNNHSDNHYAASWMLPVHVKLTVDPNTGLEKKIIFIDKKLTHKTLTNAQKLTWFTKLAAKKFCYDYSNGPKVEETELLNQTPKRRMQQRRKGEKSSERRECKGSDEAKVKNDEFVERGSTGSSRVTRSAKPSGKKCDVPSQTSDPLREQEECSESPTDADSASSHANGTDVDGQRNDLKSSSEKALSLSEEVQKKLSSDTSCDEDSEEDEGLRIDLSENELNLTEEDRSSPVSSMQVQGDAFNSSNEPMIVEETVKASDGEWNKTPLMGASCLSPGDTDLKQNTPEVSHQKPMERIDYSRQPHNGRNNTYSLWKLFQEQSPGSELLKNTRHPLNIIIRSKQDGRKRNTERGYVCIAPKVEYQCEYGAEVSSLHELLDEWASLYIRPNTDLLRVRVAHDNLEVIMSELRRCSELSHLIQLRYRLNPRHCLGNLHAVAWRLVELPPGRYLLSHEPKHNAFVSLLRADPKGSHLPMAGWQCTEGISRAAWRPLDPALVTPSHFFSKNLPALFPPSSQGAALKQNHKKRKNEAYKKHLADLKKIQKVETNKKRRDKKIAALKKKKKVREEAAGKPRAAQVDSS